MFIDQSVTPITFHKGRFKATSYLPLYRKFPTELSLSVSMSFALISVNFIHVGDCWKNRFEHNKLAIFELKVQWVPQTLFGGPHGNVFSFNDEMKIIY